MQEYSGNFLISLTIWYKIFGSEYARFADNLCNLSFMRAYMAASSFWGLLSFSKFFIPCLHTFLSLWIWSPKPRQQSPHHTWSLYYFRFRIWDRWSVWYMSCCCRRPCLCNRCYTNLKQMHFSQLFLSVGKVRASNYRLITVHILLRVK